MNEILQQAGARGIPDEAWLLVIDSGRQQLSLHRRLRLRRAYPVSTSRVGMGEKEDSFCTPRGWHEVADRIGADAALGQPFVSREPEGSPLPESGWRGADGDDHILTRIFRLRGLEPGRNQGPGIDSYARHIYIHGTHQEHRLGEPASCGCIRMANRDIAELAELLASTPAWCWIG